MEGIEQISKRLQESIQLIHKLKQPDDTLQTLTRKIRSNNPAIAKWISDNALYPLLLPNSMF